MTRPVTPHHARIRRGRLGFTTTELMIALTILAIVSAAAVTMLLNTARGMRTQREITSTEDGLRAFQQAVHIVLRAAAANPGRITAAGSLPRLEGVSGDATSCSRIRVVSDLNGNRDVSGPMEDVELYREGQAVMGRWSAGASVDTILFPVNVLTFAVQTAAGGAVACATSMTTARRVQVTIEAPRRSGSTQIVRRQWTVELRNFQ
jgi:prepilin-type N-terminal cleavage/methylation domain-containing protein